MSRATYTIDPSHSHASFAIRHMMVSTVRGEFQRFSGEVSWDPAQPEGTTASVTIETASIATHDEKRDEHLRSADFFDAATHPAITFTSKRAETTGDGLTLFGDLTMHGVTKEVALAVSDITPEARDPWGQPPHRRHGDHEGQALGLRPACGTWRSRRAACSSPTR